MLAMNASKLVEYKEKKRKLSEKNSQLMKGNANLKSNQTLAQSDAEKKLNAKIKEMSERISLLVSEGEIYQLNTKNLTRELTTEKEQSRVVSDEKEKATKEVKNLQEKLQKQTQRESEQKEKLQQANLEAKNLAMQLKTLQDVKQELDKYKIMNDTLISQKSQQIGVQTWALFCCCLFGFFFVCVPMLLIS
jgi:hypothetical protein